MPPATRYPKSIAVIGNYVPRRCGIATFTRDLCEALACEQTNGNSVIALAMDDVEAGYDYPERVKFEIRDSMPADYLRAAEFLNISRIDVAILQHEFGIFGGPAGAHILSLLENLRVPLLTTLHTVLSEPTPEQKAVICELGRLSDAMVVMSRKCSDMLKDSYQVPEDKIVIIPHGIPDVPFMDSCFHKDRFGVENRKVILTFGLLGPGKGIEHGIDAMPAIVKKHPDAVYVVLGATHPHVLRESGEKYRNELIQRARRLGVERNVMFYNQFVDLETLTQFISAADVYLTPYLERQQAVSGTLSYALGAGKAVVSTPYLHAEEMLADDRGILVPFADPGAIAGAIERLLSHDAVRNAMRKQAYQYCRGMVWKEVAKRYLEQAARSVVRQAATPRCAKLDAYSNDAEALPMIRLDHLRIMTDDTGIFQHAIHSVPDRREGYCVDDNARALIAAMQYLALHKDETAMPLVKTYLSFLLDAFDFEKKRFRDFMSYERKWRQESAADDAHGRAVWALGSAIRMAPENSLRELMCRLFIAAIEPTESFEHPRSCAFALLGIHGYMTVYGGDATVRTIRDTIAEKLFGRFRSHASEDWPWCDDDLTYANARLPHALLVTGHDVGDDDMQRTGLAALEWLLRVQGNGGGHVSVVGNNGWMQKGGDRANFSQQPLEAMALLQASADVFRITGNPVWLMNARACLDWFLGRNDLGEPVYDFVTGGCHDGIDPQGINENMGAESTLSWLISLLTMYELTGEKVLVTNRPKKEQANYVDTARQEA